ncbi:pyrroline-5-carboxylate reductase [Pelagovum pacificum]|uniref:Pyrroline-5-carboxylate reductase n=1 Tax=Pelagovum pacificum TaxID=2588711 RepID=A0A5C5GJK5_9RHOB|nr:pyrroline-5-carboxylate reductase [Pelagovum pacificum]QQA44893.1 pyrroline-5-carboxylate reductase [Pelagovum pacificum]TNY34354.1 pyrroline-5-carboxylate reductase [Pelagovum pacificum]
MDFGEIADRGLVVLGCGKMGGALLSRWLDAGLPAGSVWVLEPTPADWLTAVDGLHLNDGLPDAPAVALIAVKPQMLRETLPRLSSIGTGKTLVLSVVAGMPLSVYDELLGPDAAVVRTVPNTPAAIGHGITSMFANDRTDAAQADLAERLLGAVGEVVRLPSEDQLRLATSIAGCGPAYVFHLIETMAAAATAQGLAPDVALKLARATVAGAGDLAERTGEDPAQLRRNVTSPNGVTQAALEVLMDEQTGFPALLDRAVAAALRRDDELGGA